MLYLIRLDSPEIIMTSRLWGGWCLQSKTQNQIWWMKTRSQSYNKSKKSFTEDSLQFHQQKCASRLTCSS